MNAKVFLVILALVTLSVAQTREEKSIIDPFNPDTPLLLITITSATTFPAEVSAVTTSSTILGGERDLRLVCTSSPPQRTIDTSVSDGQWVIATPNGGVGFVVMQYDGVDGDQILDPIGLGGLDLTRGGGDAFRINALTDIDTIYTFTVTDLAGNTGNAEIELTRGEVLTDFDVTFSSFNGGVDFRNVGAIQIQIEAFDSVDSFMDFFGIVGPAQAAPSASPQPQLDDWYTFDDDDNGVSPCTTNQKRRTYFLSDDQLIYYYFYGAFQGTAGFEDDVDAVSANSSSSIIVSFVLTLIAAFVAF